MRTFRRAPAGFRWLGGVCAGLAYSLGAPAWVVRLATFVLIAFYGVGLIPYALLWAFAPSWDAPPADFAARSGG